MSSRTTLKTYFLTGATPTEAQFSDLIDSVLVLEEDLVDNFLSTSTTDALTANAGKILNDSLTSLDARVVVLENASTSYLSNYYTKAEIDTSLDSIGTSIDGKVSISTFNALDTTVSGIQSSLSGKTDVGHSHTMSDITDLQPALDDKSSVTYVDNTKSYLEGLISNIGSGGSSYDDTAIVARIATLEGDASNYATISQVSSKAAVNHNHVLADISDLDITDYYNKASVDALLANVEPKPHTHIESDITDLDKYTKAQTDQEIADHASQTNNPHNVTKTQVGLDKVENLTVAEIFNHADTPFIPTQADLDALDVSAHVQSTNNPHQVTKSQVGLGNVPDIDVNALLTAHLAADNPHNISSQYLDVYTKAETQTKIEDNYDAHRYALLPTSPTDGAGAIGDIAYDDKGLFFKFGPTDWRQIIVSKKFNDGSPGSVFEIETPKLEVNHNNTNLFTVDATTNSTTINTNNTTINGINTTINATDILINGNTFDTFNVDNLFKIDKTEGVTELNTDHVSIAGTLNVGGQVSLASGLTVHGDVSLANTLTVSGLSTLANLRATTVTVDSLDAGSGDIITTGAIKGGTIMPNNTVRAQSGNLILEGKAGDDVQVNDKLQVAGHTTVGTTSTNSNLTVNGNSTVTGSTSTAGITSSSGGTFTGAGVTIGESSSKQNLTVNGSISSEGVASSSGATFTGAGVTIGTSSANQPLTVHGTLTTGAINADSLNPNNTVKAQTGDLILEGKDGNDVKVNDTLKVVGNINATDGNLTLAGKTGNKVQVNDELDVTGATTLKGTTIGTASASSNLTVNGNTTITGNLTINGTSTTIDTTNLNIEDNFILINKNQTGTPSTSLTSGIAVERGTSANAEIYWDEATDRWKVNTGGVVKTLAFVEDAYSN